MAILHYSNSYIFRHYINKGKVARYIMNAALLVIFLSVMRSLVEVFIFPKQIEVSYFQANRFRPTFFFFSTLVTYIVSTIVLYSIYLSQKEKYLLQAIGTQNEARLQYLQSQINPHFLFNALNNIYSLAVTKSEKAPETLLMLTELLRYAVYQKPLEKVQLYDEVRKIELLISLFNLKNDVPYRITFVKHNVKGMIEPMILLPLAENCLKHCDFDINENAYAIMKIDVDDQYIMFTTENTFSDFDKPVGGVGLPNIKERLKLTYPDSHEVLIIPSVNIFNVDLKIKWKIRLNVP
jgi:two-component system LytT family sensor kinase